MRLRAYKVVSLSLYLAEEGEQLWPPIRAVNARYPCNEHRQLSGHLSG